MRGTIASYVLMGLVFGLAGSAIAGVPVAVSPGGDGGIAVISQECPTFSWSQVEGAISYQVKVFEMAHGKIGSYEIMEKISEPVIGVEIKSPAFSWTPSEEECLESGKRYVWYVGAISSLPPLRLRRGEEGLRQWSVGKVFEVDVTNSLGMREAVRETVNDYLTKEWVLTDSYKEMRKGITSQVTKEMKTAGSKIRVDGGIVQPMGLEGATNTFYGTGAGASITTGVADTFIGSNAGYSSTSGGYNTFLGREAGYSNTNSLYNTFLGRQAGYFNTNGSSNTFVGEVAGVFNTTGDLNTFLGRQAGYSNTTGSGNVFLGYRAGYSETGSNKLYVVNSLTDAPLIYGEFDTNLLRINGRGHFSGLGVSKSQLHFSLSNTDTGGWITSVADNNFWLSSGAMWDSSAGGWVQKSPDGLAVMAGSGPAGYRVITRSGCAVGSVCAPVTRLTVDYSGRVGIGITPSQLLHLAGGAYSDGLTWFNASSREYKDNIRDLTKEEALSAFHGLNPVAFTYKAGAGEQHIGFIAEDVPDLVATKDRKGISPMDIVAVLTKVVQDQLDSLKELQAKNERLEQRLLVLEGKEKMEK